MAPIESLGRFNLFTAVTSADDPLYKQLRSDVRLLGDFLGDVIQEQDTAFAFEKEEELRLACKKRRDEKGDISSVQKVLKEIPAESLPALVKAFTLYFQLVNIAEEHYRIRVNRNRQKEVGSRGHQLGSLAHACAQLEEMDIDKERLAAALEQISIQLVFTAHPTEARRKSVRDRLRLISEKLLYLEYEHHSPWEEAQTHALLKEQITGLWQTPMVRFSKPSPIIEARNGLALLEEVIFPLLPDLLAEVDASVERITGTSIGDGSPMLTFGSWMGGDRDGNPFVTPEVTGEVAEFLAGRARTLYHHQLTDLLRDLSMDDEVGSSDALQKLGLRYLSTLPDHLKDRYPHQPYRWVVWGGLGVGDSGVIGGRSKFRNKCRLFHTPSYLRSPTLIPPLFELF